MPNTIYFHILTASENQNRGDRENAVDWQDRNESDRILKKEVRERPKLS